MWASGVSLGAGLTATELDSGRLAVGVWDSKGPDVVVFDAKGEGQETRARVKKELTTELKKEDGKREILRVTPALGSGGEAVAFVDYREVGDKRRLVSCGPSDSTDDLLKFEGKPLIDESDEGGDQAKKDEPAKAAPAPAAKPAAVKTPPAPGKAGAPAKAAAAPAAGKPEPGKPPGPPKPPAIKTSPVPAKPAGAKPGAPQPKGDAQKELRECRTLVDRGGAHVWAVGSELVGKPAADGTTDWSIVLFTEQERERGRADLSTSPLGKNPTKIPVHEAAEAYDMGGGSFVLLTRFRGSLFAWVLDASKHARGPARVYSGYPAEPHVANFGPELAALVVEGAGGQKAARAARFAPDVTSLPSSLSDLVIPDRAVESPVEAVAMGGASTFAGQRFLTYVADETAKRLSVVQIDTNLAAAGDPVPLDVGVHDSALFALGDGRLLVVYIRVDPSGRSELVSKTIKLG